MNQDQFAYWLQGFVEMNGGKEPTKAQWKMIKDHLQLCFVKVTPPMMETGLSLYQVKPIGTYKLGGGLGGDADKYAQYRVGGGGKPQGGGGGC